MKALRRFSAFLKEVREEIRRVSWPGREELFGSALVVLIGVVILASYISIWDFLLSKTAQVLLR